MAKREERAVAIALGDPSRGDALEGLFIAGEDALLGAGAVIAPPHPLYGGSMESPVVNELAYAFREAGIASLRFNWRGVGASAGTPSGEPADADADYGAAVAYLQDCVDGVITACGYSFGAATALRAAAISPRVKRLVLVAPPASLMDLAVFAAFPGRALILAGEHDTLAPASALGALPDGAQLVTIPQADHFFGAGLAQIGRATRDWLG